MICLNLASGTDLRPPPWVNLDVVPRWPGTERGCDIIWDARKDIIPFPDDSVDECYAGYLFLHLAPHHHDRVLADIRRVLKPSARLVVGEVDMRKVIVSWLDSPNNKQNYELIWGEQGDVHGAALGEFDKHCHGFGEGTLRDLLRRGGFAEAKRIAIHGSGVWYELTLETFKPSGEAIAVY